MGLKILQLSKKFPYPLKDGESIAINYLSKALVEAGCEVSLLSMNTSKHFVDLSSFPSTCSHYKRIYSVSVDNKIRYLDAFFNLFSRESYHVSRFVSKAFNQKLKDVLLQSDFDIIQLETLYLTPYVPTIRDYSDAKIVMRSHNIEYKIWERVTSNTGNFLKKIYLRYLTHKLKEYEKKHINDYDSIISVSQEDLQTVKSMGFKNGAISSPIGLKINKYSLKENHTLNADKIKICFIGAMDWIPNQEGLNWFLKEIWPSIIKRNPYVELHIAGRNTSEFWHQYNDQNIIIHGEVDDAISFIKNHSIMVVPLLSGSGTRVKILESMALGVPVISTKIGFEGIAVKSSQHLMQADDASSFVEAIEKLISDKNFNSSIRKNARKHIETYYDNQVIAKDLKEYYMTINAQY